MRTAGRADEFRKSFSQAAALGSAEANPHLVRTLEVLEISGRPAVLQELPGGLPSSDWPPLVSVPGVCFRVLLQTVQGLHDIHGTAWCTAILMRT